MNNATQVVFTMIAIAIVYFLVKILIAVEEISHSLDQSKRLDELERRADFRADEGEEWKR
jgi:uncharacterized protein YoxC